MIEERDHGLGGLIHTNDGALGDGQALVFAQGCRAAAHGYVDNHGAHQRLDRGFLWLFRDLDVVPNAQWDADDDQA